MGTPTSASLYGADTRVVRRWARRLETELRFIGAVQREEYQQEYGFDLDSEVAQLVKDSFAPTRVLDLKKRLRVLESRLRGMTPQPPVARM